MGRIDVSLMDRIKTGGISLEDLRSLLALHATLATRGDFSYLELGSNHGASLQALVADPRCSSIVSVDWRGDASSDERSEEEPGSGNSTARTRERLSAVPGADLEKLIAIDADADDLDPAGLSADLCFIDAQHTNAAALQAARFCRQVIRDRGVVVFHDRTLVARGIQRFLGELSRYRAYPLAHDLLVVEINVPSLLADPTVSAQIPRRAWLLAERLGAMRLFLWCSATVWSIRRALGSILLGLGAPRLSTQARPPSAAASWHAPFTIYTFVNDDLLYERMRQSFIDAGFSPGSFVRLSDSDDDPYAAVTRIGKESTARYPILCHQDVFADQGAGAVELLAAVEQLDAIDPRWVVGGNAGIMRNGRMVQRLVDPYGGPTGESLPLPVVTLDSNFLVFNACNTPRCSEGISEHFLYGSDVCLHALASGGSAYVVDFPVTHLSSGNTDSAAYKRARVHFIEAWRSRCWFRYVSTTADAFFLSRSKLLRRLFGSSRALACVSQAGDRPTA
jgi:Methyltransferase domain